MRKSKNETEEVIQMERGEEIAYVPEPQITESPKKKTYLKLNTVLLILILVLGIISLVNYNSYQNIQENDPAVVSQKMIDEAVAKISKLIDLPVGETPVLADVSNPDLLSNNPFFEQAEKGDKVLFYTEARKAFLYRPSTNIIVQVASLNIGQ